MSVISPSTFAPPPITRAVIRGVARTSPANDAAAPVSTSLREKVRRLERAHSLQRAGKAAVPLGLPAIDALLPDGGLLTGALHEIEAGPAPSGRVAAHDGAALGFAAHLMGRFAARTPGTLLWCRRSSGVFDAPPYAPALAASFDPARLLMVTARRDEDVFWAMATGHSPFRASHMVGIIRKVQETTPPLLSEVDPRISEELAQIVARLLQKDAADRFTSAEEVCGILSRLLSRYQMEGDDPAGRDGCACQSFGNFDPGHARS